MSGGNLTRLRERLVQLHLPAFREHSAAQAALATQESLNSYPSGFSCRYLRSKWPERHERKILENCVERN